MRTTKEEMIEYHLKGRDIRDPKVIRAMKDIDREIFVPEHLQNQAYDDGPLPIGKGQTISQPYVVAYMAQEVKPEPGDVVLEVGTGCGYNAAVLSRLVKHIYSIEIVEWLAKLGKENLKKAGIKKVTARHGDGYQGWPEEAPFDIIMLTAAPPAIPEPLKKQLKIGGKLLAPVGDIMQYLMLLEKTGEDTYNERRLLPVQFVPMTGEARR